MAAELAASATGIDRTKSCRTNQTRELHVTGSGNEANTHCLSKNEHGRGVVPVHLVTMKRDAASPYSQGGAGSHNHISLLLASTDLLSSQF